MNALHEAGARQPLRPKKRLGQHFLRDPRVIERLIAVIAPTPGQHVVEIGSGTGALTAPLLQSLGELDVVEVDAALADRLVRRLAHLGALRVHVADALRFGFESLWRGGEGLRLVGNLPYNVSTPLMFHCLRQSERIADMTFMLQKEVVDRVVARPGGRDYGRLSVMVQYRCEAEILFDVEPEAFYPRPKVRSEVLRLVPRASVTPLRDPAVFGVLVRQAFSARRKTVKNALKGRLSEADCRAAGVDPGLRPEALAVSDFVRLSEQLSSAPQPPS